jgi:hypothetical protein
MTFPGKLDFIAATTRDASLSCTQYAVLCALAMAADDASGEINGPDMPPVSAPDLAAAAHLASEKNLRLALPALQVKGWIAVTPQSYEGGRGRRPHHIQLMVPDSIAEASTVPLSGRSNRTNPGHSDRTAAREPGCSDRGSSKNPVVTTGASRPSLPPPAPIPRRQGG